MRDRLAPGGIVVANVIGAVEGENSKLFRAFYRTYRSVFPSVAVHPVALQGDPRVAPEHHRRRRARAPCPSRDFLLERWAEVTAEHPQVPDLTDAINGRYEKLVPTRDVPLLTDDYAPTDALILVD